MLRARTEHHYRAGQEPGRVLRFQVRIASPNHPPVHPASSTRTRPRVSRHARPLRVYMCVPHRSDRTCKHGAEDWVLDFALGCIVREAQRQEADASFAVAPLVDVSAAGAACSGDVAAASPPPPPPAVLVPLAAAPLATAPLAAASLAAGAPVAGSPPAG